MNQESPTLCTIVASAELAYARVLSEMFYHHHPTGRMVVLLLDSPPKNLDLSAESFSVCFVEELGVPHLSSLAFRHEAMGLREALQPHFLAFLLRQQDCSSVVYLDHRSGIYAPLTSIFRPLDTSTVVLVPRRTELAPHDRFQPDSQALFQQGIYARSCLGLAQSDEAMSLLRQWQRFFSGEFAPGIDLEQAKCWFDSIPALFSNVWIQHSSPQVLGYWNLDQFEKELQVEADTQPSLPWSVVQWEGLRVENLEAISSYQSRYTLSELPRLRPLMEEYRDALLEKGHQTLSKQVYSYDSFDNGVNIPPVLRTIWAETKGFEAYWKEPFQTEPEHSFLRWLNEPEDSRQIALTEVIGIGDQATTPERLVTNLLMGLYRVLPELRDRFLQPLGRDRDDFLQWFLEEGAIQYQVDPYFVTPIRDSIERKRFGVLHRAWRALQQRIGDYFTSVYQNETFLFKIYLVFRSLLDKVGLVSWIEGLVAGQMSHQNFMEPLKTSENSSPPQLDISGRPQLGLNVLGFLRDESGLGRAARDLVAALRQKGLPVAQNAIMSHPDRDRDYPVLHNLPTGNPYPINMVYAAAGQMYIHHFVGGDFFHNRYNVGFLWWEMPRLPQGWQEASSLYQELWGGSRFVCDVLSSLSPLPVLPMKITIPALGDSSLSRADLGLPEHRHIFLYVFDTLSSIARKNPMALVKAYEKAFAPDFSQTHLVIKTKNLDQYKEFSKELSDGVRRVGGTLIDRSISRQEIDALFAHADTYVSLHRSEGYGATMAEAMLAGKPVIATGYSGNMDFMTPENSYPIPYSLVPLDQNVGLYLRGGEWAEPNLDAAAQAMQEVVLHPEKARQKGRLGQQLIAQEYNTDAVAQQILKRLEAIHAHL